VTRKHPPAACAAALEEIRRLVAVLSQSARAVEQHSGVTNAQLFLLRTLAAGPSLTINALAERAFTGQNTISAVVSRLEGKGLVRRARSATDGRVVTVLLTAAGRRLLARAPVAPTERLLDVLCALDAAQLRTVTRALGILNRGLHVDDGRAASLLFEDDAAARRVRARLTR
jgi:DNA-binding MarR family transcriptional regulator